MLGPRTDGPRRHLGGGATRAAGESRSVLAKGKWSTGGEGPPPAGGGSALAWQTPSAANGLPPAPVVAPRPASWSAHRLSPWSAHRSIHRSTHWSTHLEPAWEQVEECVEPLRLVGGQQTTHLVGGASLNGHHLVGEILRLNGPLCSPLRDGLAGRDGRSHDLPDAGRLGVFQAEDPDVHAGDAIHMLGLGIGAPVGLSVPSRLAEGLHLPPLFWGEGSLHALFEGEAQSLGAIAGLFR